MAITWDAAVWSTSTAYPVGARVVNPASTGAAPGVYQATVGGSSATTGSGPTATTGTISDGSVRWVYLGPSTGSVVDVAPELHATAAPAQQVFLALAESVVADAALWGDLFDDGRRYVAAHFGQLARNRGHGQVTSEGVGSLSRGYASTAGNDDWSLTPAGRIFASLAGLTSAPLGAVP